MYQSVVLNLKLKYLGCGVGRHGRVCSRLVSSVFQFLFRSMQTHTHSGVLLSLTQLSAIGSTALLSIPPGALRGLLPEGPSSSNPNLSCNWEYEIRRKKVLG